eukprot:4526090-Prorocentrum_lima.AAC.1
MPFLVQLTTHCSLSSDPSVQVTSVDSTLMHNRHNVLCCANSLPYSRTAITHGHANLAGCP